MSRYFVIQVGRLCINIGNSKCSKFHHSKSGWCLFIGKLGSIAWWRFFSGVQIGLRP